MLVIHYGITSIWAQTHTHARAHTHNRQNLYHVAKEPALWYASVPLGC